MKDYFRTNLNLTIIIIKLLLIILGLSRHFWSYEDICIHIDTARALFKQCLIYSFVKYIATRKRNVNLETVFECKNNIEYLRVGKNGEKVERLQYYERDKPSKRIAWQRLTSITLHLMSKSLVFCFVAYISQA